MKGLDPAKADDKTMLDSLCSKLADAEVINYYTCHCTSEVVYNYMATKMDNISDIKTGSVIEF